MANGKLVSIMVIGVCVLQLYLPGVTSLKAKRSILKPLLHQLRRRFEVAAAEVNCHDVWQSAGVAIVAVANESGHIHQVLEKAVHWIEVHDPRVEVIDWQVELR